MLKIFIEYSSHQLECFCVSAFAGKVKIAQLCKFLSAQTAGNAPKKKSILLMLKFSFCSHGQWHVHKKNLLELSSIFFASRLHMLSEKDCLNFFLLSSLTRVTIIKLNLFRSMLEYLLNNMHINNPYQKKVADWESATER